MTRATRLVGWAVLAQLVLISASGAYLYVNYRPSPDGLVAKPSSDVRRAVRVSDLHAVQSKVLVASAVVFLVLLLVKPIRSPRGAASGLAQLGFVFAASFTGLLLPWDLIGLWAVTVGTNMKGFRPIVEHAEQIRFVAVGGSEVSPDTVAKWLGVHAATTFAAAAAAVVSLATFSHAAHRR